MRAVFLTLAVLLSTAFGIQLVRRFLVSLIVVPVAFGLAAAPASAQGLPISGPFTATSSFEFGGGCMFVHFLVDVRAELSTLGMTSSHLDFCVDQPPGGATQFPVVSGNFTLTASNGTLSGGVGGFVDPVTEGFPFQLVLSVTAGTGQLESVTGVLVLDGFSAPGGASGHGTVTGALAGLVPTTKSQCKQGGWRDFADTSGVPFRNEGQCVNFVVHNS